MKSILIIFSFSQIKRNANQKNLWMTASLNNKTKIPQFRKNSKNIISHYVNHLIFKFTNRNSAQVEPYLL